ncbi:MAG: AAA family ATPase [Candidatus Thorarchaeota archaeon]|jgi:dephospho-CoA kinase
MKLIIVTGMPGAGKSGIAGAFQENGIPIIVMGDVIREETIKRGLDPNPENTKKVMLELREKGGLGAVAEFCVDELKELKTDTVVIEGCRSIAEIDVFDDFADEVVIVCVHSSPKERYNRLRERNRDDAPPTWEEFRERDIREISVGLGGVIALCDIMVVNDGTLVEFQNQSVELVKRLA